MPPCGIGIPTAPAALGPHPGTGGDFRRGGPAAWGPLALVATVIATAAAVPLGSQARAGARLALLVVAAASFAGVLAAEARRPFLTRRAVLAGVLVTLAVAVAVPPQGSGDLWSYAAYGRIVAHYRRSPYRTVPDQVGPDPITARVPTAWRGTPSVYGPVFVAVAATGSQVAGASPLGNRLYFQGLAAVAVLVGLALLAAGGWGPAALAFLGLNPVVAMVVVNGGHNDALVGLGVLAGVLVAVRRRPVLAGGVLGLTALVKVVAVLPVAALVVWAWRRGHARPWRAAVAAGATVAIGYAVAGGRVAVAPVVAMGGALSRASVWSLLAHLDPALSAPVVAALIVAVVVAALLARASGAPLPLVGGGVLVVYLLAAPYVLPWYPAWALPVLAPGWRSRPSVLAAAASLGLAVSYVGAPRLRSADLRLLVHPIYAWAMPLALVAGLGWLVAGAVRGPAWELEGTDGTGSAQAVGAA
ncbi:MAG: hypothetical protein ABR511_03675 [Acidimicrobiales bacterium]